MSRTYQPPHFSATFTAISWRLGGRIGQLLLFILAGSFSTFHVEAPLVTAAEVTHRLAPAPKTVTWGYFDPQTPPALRIASGDTVEIEALVAAAVEDLEFAGRSEEHTSELQSPCNLVCRLLLVKKKIT